MTSLTLSRKGQGSSITNHSGSVSNLSQNSITPGSTGWPQRVFTVSVVGLSGTEKDKGPIGVGKSCFCNRFVRPLEDDYVTEHASTLSQADFASPVINNDHWLYWGDRTLIMTNDQGDSLSNGTGYEWLFKVIEQCEFLDDESFQPMRGSNQRENYIKRAASIKLHSPDKLMYICKDQLGLETEYEQVLLQPEGRLNVDGFICVFDVSSSQNRPHGVQTEFIVNLLSQIAKTKKPIVLVATKNDEATQEGLKEIQKLLSRKELRNLTLPMVESSAHKGINVESAFSLLGYLMQKQGTKTATSPILKPRLMSFRDAMRSRQEVMQVASDAYVRKLHSLVCDHRVSWQQVIRELSRDSDFVHFCDLFGRSQAQKVFRQHLKELREKYLKVRLQSHTARLPEVLRELIPEVETIRGRSWKDMLSYIQCDPNFTRHFIPVGTMGESMDRAIEMSDRGDPRIPGELLFSNDAEIAFRNHVNYLENEWRRNRLRESFETLLSHTSQVTPGKPLADVRIFLMGKEAFEALQEQDAADIYETFQTQLIKKARLDFVELLLENVEEFVSRIIFPKTSLNSSSESGSGSVHKMPGLSEKDMKLIREKLQEDIRYRQLNRLFQSRDNMICQYASFTAFPLRPHCPSTCRCADSLIQQILLAKMHRPDSLPLGLKLPTQNLDHSGLLDFTIFGSDSLAQNLLSEIRLHIPQDRYYPDADSHSSYSTGYRLRYKCVDSAMETSSSALFPQYPSPDQCLVAVFSSKKSLEKLRSSLAHALIISATSSATDPNSNNKLLPPCVLILACDPRHLDDLPYLQQQGAQLAQSLKCPFIGVGSSKGNQSQDRSPRERGSRVSMGPTLFSREQIGRLMEAVVKQRMDRRSHSLNGSLEHSDVIDLKISMCIMCGDSDYSPHCIIGPLLNHQCTNAKLTNTDYEVQDSKFVVETFLPGSSRKVRIEIQAAAYHTALVRQTTQDYMPDGYILIYSTRRPASLRHLQCFVRRLTPGVTPILMMAVGDVAEFFSDKGTNALMTEGNETADQMNARFVTVSPATEQQIASYTPFFEEVWTRKHNNKPVPPRTSPPQLKQPLVLSVDEGHYATLSEFRTGGPSEAWSGDDYGSIGNRRPMVIGSSSPMIGRSGGQRAYSLSTASSGRGSYEQLLASSGESGGGGGTVERDDLKLMGGGGMDDSAIADDTTHDGAKAVGHGWWDLSDSPRLARRMGEGQKEGKKEGITAFFRQSLAQKIGRVSSKSDVDNWRMEKVQAAPLATPENIELNAESNNKSYGPQMTSSVDDSNLYASVVTIGDKEDSSSNLEGLSSQSEREDSSLEKLSKSTLTPDEAGTSKHPESPYSKTGRKPTPHRRTKKPRPGATSAVGPGIAERLKLLNKEFYNVAVPGAPEPKIESENGVYPCNGRILNQMHHHIQRREMYPAPKYPPYIVNAQLKKVMFKSASEESLLNPTIRKKTESDWLMIMRANESGEYADTEDTEQEENTDPVQSKKNKGFVRKVASSFRFKKKKMISADISLPLSVCEGTKSVPQSPIMAKKKGAGIFVLPPFQTLEGASFASTSEVSSNLLDPKAGASSSKSVPPSPRKDASCGSKDDLLIPPPSRSAFSNKKLSAPNCSQGLLGSKPRRLSDQGRKKSNSPGMPTLVAPGSTLRDLAPSLEDPIPTFLRRCVEFIESEGGLTLEGLYRVPGNQAQVTLLEQKFTENPSISFRSLDLPVNAVATALKNFFSYLSDPPIPLVLYDELVERLADPFPDLNAKLKALQIMMKRLPTENRFVLRYFIAHLKRVAAHAHQNSMDLRNLAKCWWPTMLRPHFDSFEMMANLTPRLEEFIMLLFEHAEVLLVSASPIPS